jgi:ABC-2 type transport system permease protein
MASQMAAAHQASTVTPMIVRSARKEWLELVRDGRFRSAAAIVAVLLVAALAAGRRHYHEVSRQHETAARATRAQWLTQGPKNPHAAAHYGVYAFKPKTQLSMIDTGVDPYLGVSAWLEAHKQNEFKYRPAQDQTALQRFGEMTAAEVLQLLVPLLIVLLTFGAFATERETGTLRQLASLGVPLQRLAAGKALGIAAALAMVLLPATAIGVLAIALASGTGVLAGSVSRSVLAVLVFLLYFLIFLALSLAVSVRARSSRLALVALLAFWMFNGLVAPRLVSDLAARRHPTPSTVDFATAMERELNDTGKIERRLENRRAEIMKTFNVTSVEQAPINFSGISLQEGEEHGNEVFDRHYGALFDTFERQNGVYQLGGYLAPLLAVRSLSMALAGTDFAHHRTFVEAAEEYRRRIQRVMNDDIAHRSRAGVLYVAGPELWSRVPQFEYRTPDTAWALRTQTFSLAALAAWAALAFLALRAALRRVAIE